ncbi:MAG: AAA family ATPase [Chloroflexota bacterium]
MEDVVTADEAARYLKVHPKTMQRWCREGRIPAIRAGNRYRVKLSDLNRAEAREPEVARIDPPADEPRPGERRARVIAVANQKGGVGKTTTAQALGSALADRGERVLLVDLDPQASLTASLGYRPDELTETIYTVICQYMENEEAPDARRAILAIDPWLKLIPSNINLSAAEVTLPNQVRREYVLGEVLAPLLGEFDWVFVDCPPSLSLLTINALTCADSCVVPVAPEPLVTVGVGLLFQTVARVRRTKLNPRLEIEGVVLTKVDARPTLTRGVIEDLRATLAGRVQILGEVRNSIRIQEASATGQPLSRYRPAADAAAAYRQIAEVIYGAHRQA